MSQASPIDVISEQFAILEAENAEMRESLADVRMMFQAEDSGWQLLSRWASGDQIEGFDLDEIKEISEKIRPHLVADALVRRGASLHTSYVWSRGVEIEGVDPKQSAGRPTDLRLFFANPINQDSLFSNAAHGVLQRARFADGNLFLACDRSNKTVRVIPLAQITGIKVNPDFPEEVWAYQRTWSPDGPNPSSTARVRVEWFYTSRYTGRRQKSFTENGATVPVSQSVTIIDRRFGRLSGFVLGVPDSIAMHVFVAAYNEVMQYGRVVNESLSRILFKVVNPTKRAAQNASTKVGATNVHGGTVSMVEGADIQAISTAGKGYSFDSARPLAAMAAASIDVSNAEFLADSSAAGSSYGALSALAPATLNSMKLMQAEWCDLLGEVFEFFGMKRPRISFPPIVEPDPYRKAQEITLLSAALTDEEYRGKALDQLDIPGNASTIPPTLAARSQAARQAASPDQGNQDASAGGADSGSLNDQRTDTIGEALRAMQLDEMRSLVERFESVADRLGQQ